MPTRNSTAVWTGNLAEGQGQMKLGSLEQEIPYTRASRFADGAGSNPEELLGAAHAGCFSMFLSSLLTKSGFPPNEIRTTAAVTIADGPTITLIELKTEGNVPNIDEAAFQEHAERAKAGCPVSKALSAVEIKLAATLVKS
jgi:osmotically inducible protein OsmC